MSSSDPTDGLIAAFVLDGEGGGREVGWEEVDGPPSGPMWVHLDYSSARARRFIDEDPRIPEGLEHALLDSNPRPRSERSDDALLIVLRGANINPEAEPEDMIALRLLVTEGFVVTVRRRPLVSVQETVEEVRRGEGPTRPAELPGWIINKLVQHLRLVVEQLDEDADLLEETLISEPRADLRARIAALRRRAIAMRRYLVPQREALTRLPGETVSWLDDATRRELQEQAQRLARLLEDLDSARDRAAVTQEELNHRQAERSGRTMYLVAILSAVFLPLTFLTGLLGINVGGIPGASHPWAFPAVSILLLGLAIAEVLVLRKSRWF